MFDIKENLKNLPDTPGVYLHKDHLGQVIYVGKAVNLKRRVSSYFQNSKNHTDKVRAMVSHISEFEYITCNTEMEALILECNLIKKYQPKYNVLLRDDKTYPYIKVTINEEYPRVLKTRVISNDGAKYFGPYSDVKAVNDIIDLLNKIYMLKRCSHQSFPDGYKPCLNFHIRKCCGVCRGDFPKDEYREKIDKVIDFLNGKRKELLQYVTSRMEDASEKMNFEKAAVFRNYLEAINSLSEVQRVTMVSGKDFDIVLPLKSDDNSIVVMFTVRDGKLSGRETFNMTAEINEDTSNITAEFIKQYYVNFINPPKEIVLEELPDGYEMISEYLSKDRPYKVRFTVPERGDKKALLDLAKRDRLELAKTMDIKIQSEKEKTDSIHNALRVLTGMDKSSYRVESYDISNTNGVDTVGAMVVFEDLKPVRKDYRRFKIKTIEGQNDYGALEEMLRRRFTRLLEDDRSFNIKPDVILMDGGLGQVTSAYKIMDELGISLAIYGMAKDDKHRTRALINRDGEELYLREYPLLFRYCGTIQEEVHRFAIEYHRSLRHRSVIGSLLDEIEGIGPKKRNLLLSHFGSIDRIKTLTVSELAEVQGITRANAEKIREFFDKKNAK
ncbi:MAG: excinuclease ABC subunit UvrC [Clostridia bacterium]|nr:excinuclease ABC subunit UvrC [Clostridia bacterium]